jgi:hypothetical protein
MDRTVKVSPVSIKITIPAPDVVITPQWDVLLQSAEGLFRIKAYAPAVIVAQTACEVASERAIGRAFRKRGVADLEAPVTGFFSSYSLKNERIRKVYGALTGDSIQHAPFWSAYCEMVKLRNDAVHEGKDIPEADARTGLATLIPNRRCLK